MSTGIGQIGSRRLTVVVTGIGFILLAAAAPAHAATLQNPLYEKPKDPNECLECR